MKIPDNKILPLFLRHGLAIFFFISIFFMLLSVNFGEIWTPIKTDEIYYQNSSSNFTLNHIIDTYNVGGEAKPISFLFIEKILGAEHTFFYTRMLNFILIFIVTILIYKLTNNKLSFLFILLPIFLSSMYLTAEIFEIMFVLLSIIYSNKSGIFIGISTILRPYNILYTLLIPNKQKLHVFVIGTLFAMILLSIGLFFPYLKMVTIYSNSGFEGIFLLIPLMLILLFIIGFNKQMIFYTLISMIPLKFQLAPHYFLPAFSFLFVGYLLNMNKDLRELRGY